MESGKFEAYIYTLQEFFALQRQNFDYPPQYSTLFKIFDRLFKL
jgi:hypothetical protein